MSSRSRQYGLAAAIACAILAFSLTFALSKDRNALWNIAHNKCVPDETQNHNPAPCALVDLEGGEAYGYVILKDIRGVAQFLMIPTRQISGIESPDILSPDVPNYWAAAWAHRDLISSRLGRGLPWDGIGLAINSQAARSQDQLHIHMDCLRADVRASLAQHSGVVGTDWAELPVNLAGGHYIARRLATSDLATHDPFKLLAESSPQAKANMALQSLALVGIGQSPETQAFVLLAISPKDAQSAPAHSEDLLDHSCAPAQTK